METATTRPCLTCGKPVKGRIDKKFCDDYCRNVYNNKSKLEESAFVKSTIAILKSNRKILAGLLGNEPIITQSKAELLTEGYKFKYHTHQYTNPKGDVYYFCFEYGYLPLDGERYLIVKSNPQPLKKSTPPNH